MSVYLLVLLKPCVCRNVNLTSIVIRVQRRQFSPNAANSNLTRPASGPFAKLMTRSVDLALPLKVARNAELSLSTASLLVRVPFLIDEVGT